MALTEKQSRFADEYLIDLNATQAAIRAGYSQKTAYSIGQENLNKPELQGIIQERVEERQKRTEVTQDYVIQNLAEVVERCMQRAPVMTGRDREQVQDEANNHLWTFNANGANKSLELIGRHLSMFTDKSEIDLRNNPMEDILARINGRTKTLRGR